MKTLLAVLTAVLAAFPGVEALGQDSARAEAARKLETMKVSVDFQGVKLSETLDYLREVTGLNIVLKNGAVEGDPTVTLKVRDLSARSVLKLLIASRGLVATWRDGAVLVLPQEELGDSMTLRFYDTRALVVKLQDFVGPVMELVKPGGGGMGVTVTIDEPTQALPPDFLVELVKDNTGARSWEHAKASITHVNGQLVVTQTAAVHREIDRLLALVGQYQ